MYTFVLSSYTRVYATSACVSKALMINTISVYHAAEKGDTKGLHRLLKSHAKINKDYVEKESKQTPLLVAAKNNSIEIVRLLLAYGADANKRRGSGLFKSGETALSVAVEQQAEELVELLSQHGAQPLKVGYYGFRQRPKIHASMKAKPPVSVGETKEEQEWFARHYKVLENLDCLLPQKQVSSECLICYESGPKPMYRLGCGHGCFHTECLVRWDLEAGLSCPLCRCAPKRELFLVKEAEICLRRASFK